MKIFLLTNHVRPASLLNVLTAIFLSLSISSLSSVSAHENEGEAIDHATTHPVKSEADLKPVRTGAGDHVYDTVPGWLEQPAGEEIGNTHGQMVIDKAGNLYITSDGKYSILVYSKDGKYLRSFGKELSRVHGMQLVEEGGEEFIYIAHLGKSRIAKIKLDGTEVWSQGAPLKSGHYGEDGAGYKPTGIAVAPNGKVYVVDGYGKNYAHIYSNEGVYEKSFGGRGKEGGKFQTCHGIAIDLRGDTPLLLISDRENRRLQHFDLDGNFKAVITEGLRRPCSVSIHGKYVAIAELQARVTIIDENNKIVAHLGDNPNKKQWAQNRVARDDWKDGIFTAPHGVCYDQDGNIFVMDWNFLGRVTRLERAKD